MNKNHKTIKTVIVVGGGAAGFFSAIRCASLRPDLRVIVLEKGRNFLQKVKISGGGRCNLSHACFEVRELVKHYPRGAKALRGPFSRFACQDTVNWFRQHGVRTKIEEDGRIFPISNKSQSVIDCFMQLAKHYKIELRLQSAVRTIRVPDSVQKEYSVLLQNGEELQAKYLVMATGSSPRMWSTLEDLGYKIIDPVPSLFTFNTKDTRLRQLSGVSVPKAHLQIVGQKKLQGEGPLLVTHWGLSGPVILKLSAWGARFLHRESYKFQLKINWLADYNESEIRSLLQENRQKHPKRTVVKYSVLGLPQRLWNNLVAASGINQENWADISKKQLNKLVTILSASIFSIHGKSTFKEEFVTAGGIDLKMIDFTRFESKLHPNLFFAGEVLDIDAITGGFNFQAAWTGAWIIGESIAES
ncbi:MAG: NAD(P)/FAD-dependent oxidoreductase [Saprospiraceae bacterium]|nr:NAD(P)/FAD-dependent oxidoreductase [Saprospiraceae bacterium]